MDDSAPKSAESTTSETIAVLHGRVSVRRYTDRAVSDAQVEAILRASFRAPTSSNIQAYSVVIVRDPETKRKLSVVTGNQKHVADAPVFLAFCADLTGIEQALNMNGHSLDDNNLETCLVSSIDATLVGMSAYLAADSVGQKGVMIGGVRNDPKTVAEILGLQHRVYCVFGMCLGWPASVPPQKPRMAYEAMVHHERYNTGQLADAVAAYDKELAVHYRGSGRETADASWSQDVDKKFHPPLRDKLRQQLRDLGFDFR